MEKLDSNFFMNVFYNNLLGYHPTIEDGEEMTENTIQYLLDCNLSKNEIFAILTKSAEYGFVSPESIIKILEEHNELVPKNNLTTFNTFYTHRRLQLVAPPAKKVKKDGGYVILTPDIFWIEPVLFFTMDDLYDYFKEYAADRERYPQYSKEETCKTLTYILSRLKKACSPYVQPLDLLLIIMDRQHHDWSGDIIHLLDWCFKILPDLEKKNKNGYELGKCRIVWRTVGLKNPNLIPLSDNKNPLRKNK